MNKIECGDLVREKRADKNGMGLYISTTFEERPVGIVVVSFAQCVGVRFNNSNEVKILMLDSLEKLTDK